LISRIAIAIRKLRRTLITSKIDRATVGNVVIATWTIATYNANLTGAGSNSRSITIIARFANTLILGS
jgi:hypothetical protein